MTLNDPPSPNVIEISLFGPGLGEAVAVHIGQGKWVVVDSCKDPASARSATLEYLERIGVDCSQDVRLVVSTHGHDDHIGGLAELLEACSSARFACPSAMTKDQFFSSRRGRKARTSPQIGLWALRISTGCDGGEQAPVGLAGVEQ